MKNKSNHQFPILVFYVKFHKIKKRINKKKKIDSLYIFKIKITYPQKMELENDILLPGEDVSLDQHKEKSTK